MDDTRCCMLLRLVDLGVELGLFEDFREAYDWFHTKNSYFFYNTPRDLILQDAEQVIIEHFYDMAGKGRPTDAKSEE